MGVFNRGEKVFTLWEVFAFLMVRCSCSGIVSQFNDYEEYALVGASVVTPWFCGEGSPLAIISRAQLNACERVQPSASDRVTVKTRVRKTMRGLCD